MLRNLDEAGVIRIGASIKQGDILVGKVDAEGRNPAHAGREAAARHLRREGWRRARRLALLPAGHRGRHRRREDFLPPRARKKTRGAAKSIEATQIGKLEKNLSDEIRILTDARLERLENILGGKEVQADLHDETQPTSVCLRQGQHS